MSNVPVRLKNEPLIEAIWQVQFKPTNNQPIGDLLPGIIYPLLKRDHPDLIMQRLSVADIPALIAQHDPNLKFAAKYRMEDPNSQYIFQVGDRVVTVNCRAPYSGWNSFKKKILIFIGLIEESNLVSQLQRHSLRYLDLINLDPAPDLSALQIAVNIGGQDIKRLPIRIRVELPDRDCTHTVQIVTPAEINTPHGSQKGSMLDVETFITSMPENWCVVKNQIDLLHSHSKAIFFEKLLTPEAITRLGPEY